MNAADILRPGTPRPILIVDDDIEIIDVITELLAIEGLPAVGALSCHEAEAAACAHEPSLVLLDDQLGCERAPQVARRLRARCGETLPIVLLSGGDDLAMAARDAGVVAALAKPFSVEELLQCIQRHRMAH